MKNIIFLISFLVICFFSCKKYDAIADVYSSFEVIVDPLLHQGVSLEFVEAIQTRDCNYLVVGNLEDATGLKFIWLEKLDRRGDMIWTRKIGIGSNRATALREDAEGNILIAGTELDYGHLIKTNAIGMSTGINYKITLLNAETSIEDMDIGSDGTIGLLGLKNEQDPKELIFVKLKNDSNGFTEIISPKNIDSRTNYISTKSSIKSTRDGGYVAVGTLKKSTDIFGIFHKLKPDGQLDWSIPFDTLGAKNVFYDVTETTAGTYFVSGELNRSGTTNEMLGIKIVGRLPDRIHPLPLGEKSHATAIAGLYDENVAIGGVLTVSSVANFQFYKIDANTLKEIIEVQGFFEGNKQGAELSCIIQTNDKGFLLAGFAIQGSAHHGYVIKTDTTGKVL